MTRVEDSSQCYDCKNKSGAFSVLGEDEIAELCTNKSHIIYKAGEEMIKQGAFATHILYLRKGVVKIQTVNRNRVLILTLETTGTFLGLPVLFGRNVFPYSVIPFGTAECCQFDINDFQSIISRNGEFAAKIMQQMNDYTLRSFDRLNTLAMKQLHGRFADIVLCLSDRIYKKHHFQMDLSRKDMAELSVMSVESLSRIIREFNDDGILKIEGRSLDILDMDKLRRISAMS